MLSDEVDSEVPLCWAFRMANGTELEDEQMYLSLIDDDEQLQAIGVIHVDDIDQFAQKMLVVRDVIRKRLAKSKLSID